MAKHEKLLRQASSNPKGLNFAEFQTLLRQCGREKRRQSGSHELWYSPLGFRLPIQCDENGKAKDYQVKQFLSRLEQEQ
jgi:hypothetical protein